ncbi:MAG: hypothetical protein CSA45_02355 [Gammaproteobacteria bacterium]|nr:MAG: hypothetical protein CSA45_02355 [Gammaproteobacteria bacterium]
MNQQLVFTVIAQDKPGIVTTLAKVVKQNGGNWLDSRMSQLAGEFAGIVHIEIPIDKRQNLENALAALENDGISITLRQSGTHLADNSDKLIEIEVIGNDRPGIVAEVSKLFAEKSMNIVELDTGISEIPVAGGMLFHANAVIGVAKGIDLDELQDKLHDLADELSLDIEWTSQL